MDFLLGFVGTAVVIGCFAVATYLIFAIIRDKLRWAQYDAAIEMLDEREDLLISERFAIEERIAKKYRIYE